MDQSVTSCCTPASRQNPFKDKRVRQAFYQAIDIDGIKKTVMRGASNPSALMVGPGINGFSRRQASAPRR